MSKPSGKYYLIEFDEDEGRTVAIVPYNWLKRKQNQCWWPNGKSNISWVVNCKDPDGTGNFFPFSRILDANDDYQKLRRREDKSLDFTDLSTETETDAEYSQPRKARAHVRYSSPLQSETRGDQSRKRSRDNETPSPRPEKRCRSRGHNSQSPPPQSNRRRNSQSPPPQSNRRRNSQSPPPQSNRRRNSQSPPPQSNRRRNSQSPCARSPRSESPLPRIRFDRRPNSRPSTTSRQDTSQQHVDCSKLVDRLTPFFEKVFKRLGELSIELQHLNNRIGRLEEMLQSGGAGQVLPPQPPRPRSLPSEIHYPIQTAAVMNQLDACLAEETDRNRAALYLSAIGGASVRDAVKNIFKKLMCPRLAVTYTFTGKNKEKGVFKDLKNVVETIYDAVRKRFPEATRSEFDSITGIVLTRNCDRSGQKQERQAQRKENEVQQHRDRQHIDRVEMERQAQREENEVQQPRGGQRRDRVEMERQAQREENEVQQPRDGQRGDRVEMERQTQREENEVQQPRDRVEIEMQA